MTNKPGNWRQGIAAFCRWGLVWLSIGLFTLLAGINLLRTAVYGTDSSGGTMHCSGGMGAAGLNGMAALKTLVLRQRGGQEKKANAV